MRVKEDTFRFNKDLKDKSKNNKATSVVKIIIRQIALSLIRISLLAFISREDIRYDMNESFCTSCSSFFPDPLQQRKEDGISHSILEWRMIVPSNYSSKS